MENTDWKLKLAKVMYLCFAITFTLSLAIVTGVFMTFLAIFVWPINKNVYRRYIKYLGYTLFAQASFMLRFWATMDFKLYADEDVIKNYLGKEHSLCIMNHSGELDWIAVVTLLDKLNILGNVKSYMKSAVWYIPFIGWGFYLCEHIFLSRSFKKDKIALEKAAKYLSEYKEPVTIFLFAEGTRFSPEKHKEAVKFCKERGMKELKHHLVPRTKGFITSVPHMKGKIPAIYDIEIAFEGTKPTISNMIMGRHFNVHVYLRRIPMEEVPDSEQELDAYLREMFYRKDQLLESFKMTGDYFQLNNYQRYRPISIDRHSQTLYNMLFWFTVTLTPIVYFIFKLFVNLQFTHLVIIFVTVASAFKVMAQTVDAMEVKK